MNRWLAFVVLAAACGTDEATSHLELAVLDYHATGPIEIDVPRTLRVGEVGTISILAHHGGCFAPYETAVATTSYGLLVIPRDIQDHLDRDHVCPGVQITETRTVDVSFPASGVYEVVVRGRRVARDLDAVIELTFGVRVE